MDWQEARRLAEAAQYGADPDTYRERPPGASTWAVCVVETPTRYVVVFQPAPLEVPGVPRQIIPTLPHSGMYQVDRATGQVQWFHALPETPGAEDFGRAPRSTPTRSWAVRRSERATSARTSARRPPPGPHAGRGPRRCRQ